MLNRNNRDIETVFETKEFKIGENRKQRTATFIEVSIYHHTNQNKETVNHKSISDYYTLSICGTVYDIGISGNKKHIDKNIISGGQIIMSPENFRFDKSDYAASQITELMEVWKQWHLNDLKPNCCHQIAFNCNDNFEIQAARESAKCPSGYKYGSAWLVKPLSVETINFILKFVPNDSIKTDRLEEEQRL